VADGKLQSFKSKPKDTLNAQDVGRLLDSASPMVKMSKMLGKSAVYGAKNKLDAARAEDPAMYDRAMEKQSKFASEASDAVKYLNRQALQRNLGLTGNASANDTSAEERRNIAGDTYKKGGKVSASSRADGCAVKGKTKGRMV
jgi:hypothetical protein